ncbi:hypothetical protein C2E25_12605 [Geothermobacter hydrogeniphilus]|uniref:Uncharacterized protein n=1 Tax=Geothermobacter hydrogeniphilus TaxID=1969733 RepID=A0A2K2H7X5_9BACT|nr:hypothetical protein [Geothermobacter hydrogeniphilus]PNU19414.1 hypothetical protein C2E25_12605 [Geothermobacter hydrogeniphilus]
MTALKSQTMTHEAGISKVERNPVANLWLAALTIVLALFATCTLVLVAWPILAWIGANFNG